MSDDIDDIQDLKYHMSRRTFFEPVPGTWVAGAWMALRARNPSPSGRATLNPQSTCHRHRPGPKLACGVRAGSLRAAESRVRGKTRGRKRKNADGPKKHVYILRSIYIYSKGASLRRTDARLGSAHARNYRGCTTIGKSRP